MPRLKHLRKNHFVTQQLLLARVLSHGPLIFMRHFIVLLARLFPFHPRLSPQGGAPASSTTTCGCLLLGRSCAAWWCLSSTGGQLWSLCSSSSLSTSTSATRNLVRVPIWSFLTAINKSDQIPTTRFSVEPKVATRCWLTVKFRGLLDLLQPLSSFLASDHFNRNVSNWFSPSSNTQTQGICQSRVLI